MNLREVIEASGKGYRGFAELIGCSHNHLHQVANRGKGLSQTLARKIKEIDDRFSLDEQTGFARSASAGNDPEQPPA